MTREIEFRAWDGETMISSFDAGLIRFFEMCEGAYEDFELTENIMQYTGLKDKNGKKIFEGDITSDGSQIMFEDGMFVPYYDFGRQERFVDVGTDWWSNCEVIGNIYQNPELIK